MDGTSPGRLATMDDMMDTIAHVKKLLSPERGRPSEETVLSHQILEDDPKDPPTADEVSATALTTGNPEGSGGI